MFKTWKFNNLFIICYAHQIVANFLCVFQSCGIIYHNYLVERNRKLKLL